MKPEQLIEHPEGGRFREVYRAGGTVTTADGRSRRGLTHIYFSLRCGEVSRFHRVAADEVWNLYRGSGIVLYLWSEQNAGGGGAGAVERIELSAAENRYCHVIPAGVWQAAEPLDDEVLVGCSVAPGFEFEDFTLIAPDSAEALQLLRREPGLARFVG